MFTINLKRGLDQSATLVSHWEVGDEVAGKVKMDRILNELSLALCNSLVQRMEGEHWQTVPEAMILPNYPNAVAPTIEVERDGIKIDFAGQVTDRDEERANRTLQDIQAVFQRVADIWSNAIPTYLNFINLGERL